MKTYWKDYTDLNHLTTKQFENALYILGDHGYNIEEALDFIMCYPDFFFPKTIDGEFDFRSNQ